MTLDPFAFFFVLHTFFIMATTNSLVRHNEVMSTAQTAAIGLRRIPLSVLCLPCEGWLASNEAGRASSARLNQVWGALPIMHAS